MIISRRCLLGSLLLASISVPSSAEVYSDACFPIAGLDPPFLMSHGGGSVLFLAAAHSSKTDSPTFALIDELLTRYTPRALIVEGFPTSAGWNPSFMLDVAATSRASGTYASEGVYTVDQAVRRGLPFIGGEVQRSNLVERQIARGVRADDLLGSYILRDARSLRIARPELSLSASVDAAQSRLSDIAQRFGLQNFNFAVWYAARFGMETADDPQADNRGSPCNSDLAGRILLFETEARNTHLLDLISSTSSADSVGVIFGANHYYALMNSITRDFGIGTKINMISADVGVTV